MTKLLRRPAVQRLIGAGIAAYVRFVFATTRWEWRGLDLTAAMRSGQSQGIAAFWHGRLALMPMLWRRAASDGWAGGRRPHMLISQSRDGEFIARAMDHLEIDTVRGSTRRGTRDKGGSTAVRVILDHVARGDSFAVTPDGPKGPRMRASRGIAVLARLANLPVYPGSFSTRFGLRMKSWDRFHVPLPFGRGVMIVGAPIAPAEDEAGDEAFRTALEESLNRLTAEADAACGRAVVKPAPGGGDARA